MVDVAVSRLIPVPRTRLAAFAGDPSNAPLWYANIARADWVGPPRTAPGGRIAFVARFLGRELRYTYEIAEHVPGRRMVMRTAEGPFPMETIYEWRDEGPATLMTLRNRGRPSGFPRLAAPLMRLAMRRAMARDLAALEAHLTGGA